MFLRSSKNRMNLKNLKNIFSLGCPKKNVKNTKMQFKKKGSPQIDQISGQVTENFMGNDLEKKNSVDFHN
jgi:hypothetical protein